MALCVHQHVDIPELGEAHIFASTRPQPSCRASMSAGGAMSSRRSSRDANATSTSTRSVDPDERRGLVCFCVVTSSPSPSRYELEVDLDDLLASLDQHAVAPEPSARVSLDRVLVLALDYLHVRSPSAESSDTAFSLEFEAARTNNWTAPTLKKTSPTKDASSPKRSHARSRSQLETAAAVRDVVQCVLQSGVIWKNAYLFVQATLYRRIPRASKPKASRPDDEELVVSVFNAASAVSSERVLSCDDVEALSLQLGAWQRDGMSPLLAFSRQLLWHLELDLDLFGHEMIVFPTLELSRLHGSKSASRVAASDVARFKADRLILDTNDTSYGDDEEECHGSREELLDAEPTDLSGDHDGDEEEEENEDDEDASDGLDTGVEEDETEELSVARSMQAAIKIQRLAKRFLRRRHERAEPSSAVVPQWRTYDERHLSQFQCAPGIASMPLRRRSLAMYNAAKRIQNIYRVAQASSSRRRAAHDVSGVRMQRALTPTTASRSARASREQAREHDADDAVVDTGEERDPDSDDEDDDDEEMADNDSQRRGTRLRSVDVLDTLSEDVQGEQDAARTSSAIAFVHTISSPAQYDRGGSALCTRSFYSFRREDRRALSAGAPTCSLGSC
ncbi:hypothetical protein PINS_up004953 [Pythium insidiosum]|nr:hypothetical protein PINS_up004953 [Pythium insidiosum]